MAAIRAEDRSSENWRNVDRDPATAVGYLELVGRLIGPMKQRATEKLRLQPGARVLEIGFGTGQDSEEMARLVGPGGHVTAVDISAELVAKARARVAPLGLPITFQVADARELPFESGSFDAVRIERVLQHIHDPVPIVREMVRVVHRGGRVVAFEPDWESISAAGGPVHVLRAVRACSADITHAFGRCGRETPHLLQAVGCREIDAEAVVMTINSLQLADYVIHLRTALDTAVGKGLVSEADAGTWWNELASRDAAGSFTSWLCGTIVSGIVS